MSAENERNDSLREHTEAMEHWGESPRDPKAHERSEELAARAALPSEAERRDKWVGVQDEADPTSSPSGEQARPSSR